MADYSKFLFIKPPAVADRVISTPTHVPEKAIKTAGRGASIGAEVARSVAEQWQEVALDATQLGLTIVGLLDIAPRAQAAADVANGSIDIARGHPWIGALSIVSSAPLLGLVSGLGLACFRVLKLVWSTGKCLFAIATVGVKCAFRFVVTRGGQVLKYFPESGKVVDAVGNMVKELVDNILKFAKKLTEVDPKCFEPVGQTSTKSIGPGQYKRYNPTQRQKIEHEVQSKYGTYRTYSGTYGNMGKGHLW